MHSVIEQVNRGAEYEPSALWLGKIVFYAVGLDSRIKNWLVVVDGVSIAIQDTGFVDIPLVRNDR